ncbi:hypothetical protein MTO96_037096 [Rhipicephalus appendiculatus]
MKACVLLALLSTAYAATVLSPRCKLEKDTGRCNLIERKWWFNKDSGKCELFYYGGCGGNENRFDEKMDCEEACINPQPDVKPSSGAPEQLSPQCEDRWMTVGPHVSLVTVQQACFHDKATGVHGYLSS